VRGPGSIPGWLLVPVAFAVLVALRSASLALGRTTPETPKAQKGKVTPMTHATSMLSITAETAWALGAGMLAGLPLLT
jgi:hypothetical protein